MNARRRRFNSHSSARGIPPAERPQAEQSISEPRGRRRVSLEVDNAAIGRRAGHLRLREAVAPIRAGISPSSSRGSRRQGISSPRRGLDTGNGTAVLSGKCEVLSGERLGGEELATMLSNNWSASSRSAVGQLVAGRPVHDPREGVEPHPPSAL